MHAADKIKTCIAGLDQQLCCIVRPFWDTVGRTFKAFDHWTLVELLL